MTEPEDRSTDVGRLMSTLFGPDYGGPLRSAYEWHALEFGFSLGAIYYATGRWELVAPFVLVALGRGVATTGLLRQIQNESHYFLVPFALWIVARIIVVGGVP